VLSDEPERTEKICEIVEALAGRHSERLVRRVRKAPGGARLFAERPRFDPSTCDFDALLALPVGSFGRTYAAWMQEHHSTPGSLEPNIAADDPDLIYIAQRMIQVHDFWHVLSGYNRDPLGELGVLTFGWAQTHSRGIGSVLATLVWLNLRESWRRGRVTSPLLAYLWRAWRTGRNTCFLAPVIFEDFFDLPLATVRKLLRIAPFEAAVEFGALVPFPVPTRAVG
jgi:ubiquinone biosynthesis protein COQ4